MMTCITSCGIHTASTMSMASAVEVRGAPVTEATSPSTAPGPSSASVTSPAGPLE
ncbi:MAG: hypothetical protein MUC50_14705 [Myxococcota bacterium]|nr:hypothetical protein [Myxococcota bacterium]